MPFPVSLSQYENYSEAAINFAYFRAILSMLYRNMKSIDNCDKILPFSYRNSPWIVYCDNRLAKHHDFDHFLSQKSPIFRIAIKRTPAIRWGAARAAKSAGLNLRLHLFILSLSHPPAYLRT